MSSVFYRVHNYRRRTACVEAMHRAQLDLELASLERLLARDVMALCTSL